MEHSSRCLRKNTVYILINVEDDTIICILSSKFYVKEISRRKDLSSNNSYIYKQGIKLFALQLAVCEVCSFGLSIAICNNLSIH